MSIPVVKVTTVSKIKIINARQPTQAQVGNLTDLANGNDKSPGAGFESALGPGDAGE
jgi:hypothetical protein